MNSDNINNIENSLKYERKNKFQAFKIALLMIIFTIAVVMLILATKSVLEGRKDFDEVVYIVILAYSLIAIITITPMLKRKYQRQAELKKRYYYGNTIDTK